MSKYSIVLGASGCPIVLRTNNIKTLHCAGSKRLSHCVGSQQCQNISFCWETAAAPLCREPAMSKYLIVPQASGVEVSYCVGS